MQMDWPASVLSYNHLNMRMCLDKEISTSKKVKSQRWAENLALATG